MNRTPRDVEHGDVRTLLGMQTPLAWTLVIVNAAVYLALIIDTRADLSVVWPSVLAWALVTSAGCGLLLVRSDPIPRWAAACIASVGAVSVIVVGGTIEHFTPHQLGLRGAVICVFAFLCVSGATGWAWLGFIAEAIAAAVWSHLAGLGAGLGFTLIIPDAAALAMATFFALTIRPAARSFLQLRSRESAIAAAEAAAAATLAERDRRIGELGLHARPMLERIASGAQLDEAARQECRLVEGLLRDQLRGSELAREPVIAAVRAARSRGVEVVLLDDGGLADAAAAAGDRMRQMIADEVAAARDGWVTARVLPAGRDRLGTIVVDTDAGYRRIEFGADGGVVSRFVDDESKSSRID